ncbi:hypothetical protein KJ605_00635, partial [Patescibacteria group bacterium]|nr:hypothetical protein [Patescibacteria group bacterium]MBU1970275.1 hypothetical protein [Patescibacteria group bacterium]
EYWIINGIKIYGYDLVNPDEYFSAYDFLDYFSRHRQPFLVGGTGFYIDVVTGRAVLEGGAPDMELRVELARLRVEELSDRLLALNKSVHQKTDLKNPARLIRAIEKAVGTKSEPQPPKMTIDPVFIGLTAERNVLYSRADNWVEEIFAEPLFAEVRQLHMRFPRSHRLQGLIYKSAVDYLTGMATLADAKQQAKFDMHAYIRRQQTYFKRNREIKWFDVLRKDFDGEVTSLVESLLDGQRDFYLN